MDPAKIQRRMPLLCSEHKKFAEVDRVDGILVKAVQDDDGTPHWFPTHWITHVDEAVHLDRPGYFAKEEWSDDPPQT